MISYKQIQSIKMAQKDAGLADEAYRALLFDVAGVSSCKDLDSAQVVDVLREIKEAGKDADETSALPVRKGWQVKQIKTWKKYVRYCKMTALDAAQLLQQITGETDVESPKLKQADFDMAMGTIESRLEEVNHGEHGEHGEFFEKNKIDINYWRNRRPKAGKVNTRESWEIRQVWVELQGYLCEENRTDNYLLGIIAHTCRFSRMKPVSELTSRESLKAIEALKQRIRQCERKLQEEVPF